MKTLRQRVERRIATHGQLRIQFDRMIKRAVELDILLMDNPTSYPTVYCVAQEVLGHAAEMMRLSGSLARAEIKEKWKKEQEKQPGFRERLKLIAEGIISR